MKKMSHVPYLENSTAYDHDFWHTFCEMIISPAVFENFDFWGVFSGVKEKKKWSKIAKNYVCRTPYLRNHTSHDYLL